MTAPLAFLSFESPQYLLLLLTLPLLVWFSFRSLSGLGPIRRILAIAMRCVVVALMILALAGAYRVKSHDTLGVIFAVDRSSSISPRTQQAQFDFIREAAKGMRPDDQMAVLAFDGSSAIEQLPMGTLGIENISEPVIPSQTNPAAALRMAMALFPTDAARRLVVMSDGNENVGQLLEEADWFAANKVPVDVLPAEYEHKDEIVFERLSAPATATTEETINLQMVLRNQQREGRPVSGRIFLYHNDELLDLGGGSGDAGYRVTLDPGLTRLTIPVPLRYDGAHRFRATFEPDDAKVDTLVANNAGQAFTIVAGQGRILILAPEEDLASAQILEESLEREGLDAVVELAGERTLDPVRLIDYAVVILSNVAANHITEAEHSALASYVRDLGGGLIMLGGDQSFGAGGWMGTPVEDIMPVSFDVKNKKQIPKGALALIMHACEIPRGNYWGERVAVAAIKSLSSRDLVGVLSYRWSADNQGAWDVPLQTVGDKTGVIRKVKAMQMGDMPDFDPIMRPAVDALVAAKDAAAKHMIVISDFDPMAPRADLVQKMVDNGITCSTVAIGYGGHPIDEQKAMDIARTTKGKFYRTDDFSQLPQIFIKEARVIRRALINEIPFQPILRSTLPQTVRGLEGEAIPRLYGYVVTTPRPLAEIPLINHTADGDDPILAQWQIGLGKTVAFTSGMWPRWGTDWSQWPAFSKLWAQIVRWASRQSEEAAFDVSTSLDGGKGKIRLEALDKNASSIDFLKIQGNLVTPAPEYSAQPLKLTQTGPGVYEAEFDARNPGNYLLNLVYDTAAGAPQMTTRLSGQLRTGLAVAYSPEYRDLKSNLPLLHELAGRTGGRVLSQPNAASVFDRSGLDEARTRRPIWEDLIRLMLLLFLLDVAIRRIAISPIEIARKVRVWIGDMAGRRRPAEASAAALSTLKATRQRVQGDMRGPGGESAAGGEAPPGGLGGSAGLGGPGGPGGTGGGRSETGAPPTRSARYEAAQPDTRVTEDLSKALGGASEQSAPVVARPTRKAPATNEADYTSRLLQAKRRARGEPPKEGGGDSQ